MLNLKLARKFHKKIKRRIDKEKSKRQSAIVDSAKETLEDINADTPVKTGYLLSRNKLDIFKNKITFSNDTHYSDDVEYEQSFFRINLIAENFIKKIKQKLK